MKKHVTRSFFEGETVVKIPYCNAQNLLHGLNAVYYNAGVYGWNYDVYRIFFNNSPVYICTGYRVNVKGIQADYETISNYDKYAENIIKNGRFDYDVIRKQLDNLLSDFLGDVINN